MEDVEKGNSVTAVLSVQSANKDGVETEDDKDPNKIQLQLKLLDKSPQKIPRWMQHYRLASYIIYGIIAFYAFIYLIFIGVHQANPRMLIQYAAVVRYLEYNSYSILSPLLCPVLMALLAYLVRKRVLLDEGDFFGILGVLLILALINFHDAWGVLKLLHWNRDHDIKVGIMKPPIKDISSRKDLHWQYAWSTKTVCARKFVRNLQYEYAYSRKHVVRQIILDRSKPQGRSSGARQTKIKENPCNQYHGARSTASIRVWMQDLQNEYQCCGPYGYKEWKEWFTSPEKTGCDLKWIDEKTDDIPSCYDPLMRWLDDLMLATFWIMSLQGIFYIISMFLAGLHHSAMKLETKEVEKKYSLLSMTPHEIDEQPYWYSTTRPSDRPAIEGDFPLKPEGGKDDAADGTESKANAGLNHERSRDDNKSSGSKKKKKKDRSGTIVVAKK